MIPSLESDHDEPISRDQLKRALFAPLIGLCSGSIAPFVLLDMSSPLDDAPHGITDDPRLVPIVPDWTEEEAKKWEAAKLAPPLLHPPNACTARRRALRAKKRLRWKGKKN